MKGRSVHYLSLCDMSLICCQATESDDRTASCGMGHTRSIQYSRCGLCWTTAAEVRIHTKASHCQVLCLHVRFIVSPSCALGACIGSKHRCIYRMPEVFHFPKGGSLHFCGAIMAQILLIQQEGSVNLLL